MWLPWRWPSIRGIDIFAIFEREGMLALLAAMLMFCEGGPISEVMGALPLSAAVLSWGCDYIYSTIFILI